MFDVVSKLRLFLVTPFDERNIFCWVFMSPAMRIHADVFLFLRKRKYLLEVIPKNILNQKKNKANLWLLEVMLEFDLLDLRFHALT